MHSDKKYENLIKRVDAKYRNVVKRRNFKSTSYVTWFVVIPGIARLLSLLLRLSLLRAPYVAVMTHDFVPKKLRDRLGWAVRKAVRVRPPLSKAFMTGKALIIYYSTTGNTEKVALAIQRGCKRAGLRTVIKRVSEAFEEQLYDYDLVCIGTPVVHGLPPHPIMRFMLDGGIDYRKRHEVSINSEKIPGKNALVFVTFSGPHIGAAEAIPAGKYVKQNLEHLGFDVKDEWYVVGEFHGWEAGSTRGKLGDIRGRPNPQDLARIEENTIKLIDSLKKGKNTLEKA